MRSGECVGVEINGVRERGVDGRCLIVLVLLFIVFVGAVVVFFIRCILGFFCTVLGVIRTVAIAVKVGNDVIGHRLGDQVSMQFLVTLTTEALRNLTRLVFMLGL